MPVMYAVQLFQLEASQERRKKEMPGFPSAHSRVRWENWTREQKFLLALF